MGVGMRLLIVGCVSSIGGCADHFAGFWFCCGGLSASATPARCGTAFPYQGCGVGTPVGGSSQELSGFPTRLLAGPNSSRSRSSTVFWCRMTWFRVKRLYFLVQTVSFRVQ